MATTVVTPLINGTLYSWSNIAISLLGTPFTGVTKIEYSRKQKMDPKYGIGIEPIGIGYGNATYEGSITMYLDTWQLITNAAPNGQPTLIPFFNITVDCGNFVNGSIPLAFKDTLWNCQFMAEPFTASQDETGMTVTIPLFISAISRFQ